MNPKHLSQRALRHAPAGVRATITPRAPFVLFLLMLLCVNAASAMTRTAHPKARSAAQVQEPVAPRTNKKSKNSAARKSAPSEKATAKASKAPSKSRNRRQPVPVDDPIPMSRASRRVRETSSRELAVKERRGPERNRLERNHPERAVESHFGEEWVSVPRRKIVIAKPQPKATEIAAAAPTPPPATSPVSSPAPVEKRVGTTADFFRAAQGPPPSEIFAQGEAHPDDDERMPVASVSADNVPPPTVAQHRVSGFGAEGDVAEPGHRTLAQTMAKRKTIPVAAPPAPTAAERVQITEEVSQPMVLPAIYTPGGRLRMPAPLKGSREILVHQNTMADRDGLDRIEDDDALNRMVAAHLLTHLSESNSLLVNEDLPQNRRYARPWTVRFANDLAAGFYARFHEPLQVNSAVRTVAYQIRLMRVNGNAAPPEGATASPHLTGQAIDFGKRGMSSQEIAWMRTALAPLIKAGKVDVEEEFQQACFHISVYRSYAPAPVSKRKTKIEVAAAKRSSEDDGPAGDSVM